MTWYLNPALETMRAEVNSAYPFRDQESDGTIGDEAHQETDSDHNPDPAPEEEVDAWDCDKELNGPGNPFADDVEFIIACFEAHESSKYWIYNRVIARRSTGWKREEYTGDNPHDKHIHFNTREEFDESTKPFGIEMNQKEKLVYDTGSASRQIGHVLADLENFRNWWVSPVGATGIGVPPPGSVGALLVEAALMILSMESGPVDSELTADEVADELAERLKE